MLYGWDDIVQRRRFVAQSLNDAECRREHQRLDLLISFGESVQDRRSALLGAFDAPLTPCRNCDNCQHPPLLEAERVAGQKVLSVAYRTDQDRGQGGFLDTGQPEDYALGMQIAGRSRVLRISFPIVSGSPLA